MLELGRLLGAFSQSTRLLRLRTPLGAQTLLAEYVRGEEEIGAPYTFHVSALALDASISLRSLLGKPALLELLTVMEGACRAFHGYISAAEICGSNGGMTRYSLTLQPWTFSLTWEGTAARSTTRPSSRSWTSCSVPTRRAERSWPRGGSIWPIRPPTPYAA